MTAQQYRGPIVIDTDVYGADLVPGSKLAEAYEPIVVGRPAFRDNPLLNRRCVNRGEAGASTFELLDEGLLLSH